MIDKRHDTDRLHDASSRELQDEIAATRREMDETLDALGERLHPRHLLDHVLDWFRSASASSSHEAREQMGRAGHEILKQVRRHPMPYALMAAGAIWRMFETPGGKTKVEFHSIPDEDGPYAANPYAANPPTERGWKRASVTAAPWQAGYNWSTAKHDEKTWQTRARSELSTLKTTMEDSSRSPAEKLKTTATAVLATSGRKRREIHEQWADLDEHSGSVVDARNGRSYGDEDEYGQAWHELAAADYFADYDETDEDARTWSDRAGEVVEDIRKALASGGDNVKETLSAVSAKIGAFAHSTGAVSRSSGRRVGSRARHMAGRGASGARYLSSRTSAGMSRLSDEARHMAARSREGLQQGYVETKEQIADGIERYPLAAGAAALGIGLLAGCLLPKSRTEDRWMGETSDDVKRQARDTARQAIESGKQVASSTAEAAKDEAQKQNLTPDAAGTAAKQTIADTAEKAEETMEDAVNELTDRTKKVARRAEETAEEETRRQMNRGS